MSADPVKNNVSFSLRGDIACSNGQLGMTTQAVDTIVGTINQVPGVQYSDYYSHYLVDISAGNSADFILASIGTEISVGYTMTIDCIGNGAPSDLLSIRASDLSLIGQLSTGGKIILVAVTAPNKWKTAYGIPEGTDNHLIVYNGIYPQVDTLPIQKEFYFDGSFQYGIKCIQSYDFTEPLLLANLTNYNNLNRIIFEGCTNISTLGLTTISGAIVNSFISCNGIRYSANAGTSISSAIACYGTNGITQIGNSRGVFIAGSNSAHVNNTGGNSTLDNCGIVHSNASSILGTAGGSITNASILASSTGTITNSSTSSVSVNDAIIGSSGSTITAAAQSSVLSSNLSIAFNTANSCVIGSNNSGVFNGSGILQVSNCGVMFSSNSDVIKLAGTSISNSSIISCNDSDIALAGSSTTNSTVMSCNNSGVDSGSQITIISATDSRSRSSSLVSVISSSNSNINNSNNSSVMNSTGSSVGTISSTSTISSVDSCSNSIIPQSIGCKISSSDVGQMTIGNYSSINSSIDCSGNTVYVSGISNSYNTDLLNNTLVSAISCDTCNGLNGNAVFTRGATGYNNNRAGITLISSYGVPFFTSASSLRYCVVGGVNAANWSIDSKTGNFYGLGTFNSGTPLPGFAEMYENLVQVEIPYGRLLQVENGKVRLARNGESGFMISRPFESAAFVAGNPALEWNGKYELDIYGLPVMVDYTRDEYLKAMEIIGVKTKAEDVPEIINSKKVNQSYDLKQTYLPRSQRLNEWTTCEKSGIVIVDYAGKISIGDFLISGADGIAKRSIHKSNIRVLEIIDEIHAKVDLANQNISDYVDADVTIKAGIASDLPADISIKDIVFGSDSIVIGSETLIKITASLVGDISVANDLVVELVGKNNTYDLSISTTRIKSAYTVTGIYRGIVQPDTYQLVFSGATPTECKLYVKV
jgi:Peptidase_G2, IMC autoproteolytic cleavage domain